MRAKLAFTAALILGLTIGIGAALIYIHLTNQ